MLGVLDTRPVRNPRQTHETGHHLLEGRRLRHRFNSPRCECPGEILAGGKHGHRCAGASTLDLPHDSSPVAVWQHQVDHRQIERTVPRDEPQRLGDRSGVVELREIAGFLWLARGPEGAGEHDRKHLREEDMILHDQDVFSGPPSFHARHY